MEKNLKILVIALKYNKNRFYYKPFWKKIKEEKYAIYVSESSGRVY